MADPTNKIYYCPTEVALDLIGGKWKPLLLQDLRGGTRGFEHLSRNIPLATPRMLSRQLRELERDGLVERRVLGELPPPIEYRLTTTGERFLPILDALSDQGLEHARRNGVVIHELREIGDAGSEAPAMSEVS